MRDHVIRNSSRLRTYHDVRTELLEISRANRVLSQMPSPMDIGAAPFKKGGKRKGKNPSKDGKGKNQKGGKGKEQKDHSNNKGKGGTVNPNADKQCHYCKKWGHLKAECRKKAADEKADKNKGKGSGKPCAQAAAPENREPEPVTALPQVILDDGHDIIAALVPSTDILVDTGAGSNLFVKNFDPHAFECKDVSSKVLTTITGEPLKTPTKKQSYIETSGGTFQINYSESHRVGFNVMSAGQAANRGTWNMDHHWAKRSLHHDG